MQQFRAGGIEGLARPRHVGHGDIGGRRQYVRQAGAAIKQRQDLHQDRCAEHRDVGDLRHQCAQRMRHLLGFGGLRDDRCKPRLRILDVGGDRADHAEHLIVGIGVALLAQRDRHRGRHRFRRERALLQQIAPHHPGSERQHYVVKLAAGLFGERLGPRQRNRGAGKASLRGNRLVQDARR